MTVTARNNAIALHKAGQHVILIGSNSKIPIGKRWQELGATSEAIAQHDGNFGWMIGDKHCVVDVDTEGDTLENALQPLYDAVPEMRGLKPNVMTPSGGCHYYFLNSVPELKKRINFVGNVDYLTKNAYILIPGCEFEGNEYKRGEALGAQKMPKGLIDYLRAKLGDQVKPATVGDTESGSSESTAYYGILTAGDLRTILEQVGPEKFRGDMLRWAKFAYACNHATAGKGEDEFVEWAQRDPKYASDSDKVRAQFQCGDGTEGSVCTALTMGYLIKDATKVANSYLAAKINVAQDQAEILGDSDHGDLLERAEAAQNLEEAAKVLADVAEANVGPLYSDKIVGVLATRTGAKLGALNKELSRARKQLSELRREIAPDDADGLVDAFVAHLRNTYSERIASPGGVRDLRVWSGTKWEPQDLSGLGSMALKATKVFTGGKSLSVPVSEQIARAAMSRISVEVDYFAPQTPSHQSDVLGRAYFKNCVVEIKETGWETVEANPEFRNIDTLQVDYKETPSDGALDLWDEFLTKSLMPTEVADQDLEGEAYDEAILKLGKRRKARLETMIGYTLAQGFPWLKKFAFVFGTPNTGKSVLVDMIYAMLGEGLSTTFDTGSFGLRNNFGFARVPGRAAVIIPEVVANSPMNVAQLKAFVAGDKILCNQKHRPEYEFSNHSVLWMVGNVIPDFRDESGGVATRICTIPFTGHVAPGDRDIHLRAKLLENLDDIATHCLNVFAFHVAEDRCKWVMSEETEHVAAEVAAESGQDVFSDWLQCVLQPNPAYHTSTAAIAQAWDEFAPTGTSARGLNSPVGRKLAAAGHIPAQAEREWDGLEKRQVRGILGHELRELTEKEHNKLKNIY